MSAPVDNVIGYVLVDHTFECGLWVEVVKGPLNIKEDPDDISASFDAFLYFIDKVTDSAVTAATFSERMLVLM